MLDAGRPPRRIAGLSVFFDHADQSRRHVVCDRPRLVATPEPKFSLVLYRGADSGGMLQFETTLAPTADQLARVTAVLAREGPAPTLAPPDYRAGRVRLAGWLDAEALAPRLLVVGPASLIGHPSAMIAAHLDVQAASLAAGALKGNALPTVVSFELELLALAGPLGVEVEADLVALHDRLRAEGALTTPYGRARIAGTWESALRDRLIRVHIVDESGDIESRQAEAMRRVGEDLLTRMFSPYLPAGRATGLSDDPLAPIELSFRLGVLREELSTTARWDFRERRAVLLTHHAAAGLLDLIATHDAEALVSYFDLSENRREIRVNVLPGLAQLGLAALTVDFRRGPDQPVVESLVLTDAGSSARFDAEGWSSYEYRVSTRFDPLLTNTGDVQSEWQATTALTLVLSAHELFLPRRLTVMLGRVELDWLDHVEVVVQAPGQPPRTLVLDEDTRRADVFFPAARGEPLGVRAHWRGQRDEPSLSTPAQLVQGDLLLLDSPFGDSINVLAIPLPLARVASAVVELRTQARDFSHGRTLTWDAGDRSPKRAALRRLVDGPRRYAHRSEIVAEDGSVERRPWTESDANVLIVGADGPVSVRKVEVLLLGGGPRARGCFGVELTLEAGAARASELLEGDRDGASLVLVVPEGAPTPLLTMREFLDSGEIRTRQWSDPESIVIVDDAHETQMTSAAKG